MTTSKRVWWAAILIGVALVVQTGLQAHLMSGPSNTYPGLRAPLAAVPMEYEIERKGEPTQVWRFVTSAAEPEILKKLPFKPRDMVFRRGRAPAINVDCECYIVQSEGGEDRLHHPDICMRDVRQIPEDESARATILIGGDSQRPVQRFSFNNGPNQATTVYYWHYTILPEERDDQTRLQQLHQMYGRNPPSMTVQLTTTASRDRWPDVEKGLIAELDRKLRSDCLPAGVRMGCDRLPIGVLPK